MLKRLFDIVTSGISLLLLLPFMAILALMVKLNSPGPVFYHAKRTGRFGEPFWLLKFRSMVVNADQMGPAVTGANDPRVTRIGRFLRRSKLDELPQLLNVLRGDMSLVGPRPEDSRYVALYTNEQRQVLNVRPGITSPASLAYRNEETTLVGEDWEKYYIEHVMPAKLAIDLDYARSASLLKDIKIILKTFLAIIIRSNR